MQHRPFPRGRGGGGGGQPMLATDTLHVSISDISYPVTQDVIEKVFSPIAPVQRVHMVPPQGSGQEPLVAVVQFHDVPSAEAARAQRNQRYIYDGCNKMTINFTRWDSFVPNAVLPPPQTGGFVEGPYGGGGGGGGGGGYPPRGGGGYGGAQPYNSYHNNEQGGGGYRGGGGGGYPPPRLRGSGFDPYGGRGGNIIIGRGRGATVTQLPQGAVLPTGMLSGAMPMAMPFFPPPAMMQSMMAAMPPKPPPVYISLAMFSDELPLQRLFTLVECYGGVVNMRRNFQKPMIITVKMSSPEEAQIAAKCIRNVPLNGQSVCGRVFPDFQERNPIPDGGDPEDVETKAYDFSNSPHRRPEHRSHCCPSEKVKIYGLPEGMVESDLLSYFNGCDLFPEAVALESDGGFLVTMNSIEAAVRLLVTCNGRVCGCDSSVVVIVEGTESSLNLRPPQQSVAAQETN